MVKLKLWESKRGYNSCCHCSFSPYWMYLKKNSEIVEEQQKIEKEKKRNENAGRKKSKKKLLIVRYENAGNSQVSLSLIHFPSLPYFISSSKHCCFFLHTIAISMYRKFSNAFTHRVFRHLKCSQVFKKSLELVIFLIFSFEFCNIKNKVYHKKWPNES